jgi:hypothetical protein
MFSAFYQGVFVGCIGHWALSYYCPDVYQSILIHGFYGLVYAYTKLEYYYTQYKSRYLPSSDSIDENVTAFISVIQNGKCVNVYPMTYTSEIKEPFDFLIGTIFSTKDNMNYKMIYHESLDSIDEYEPCSFKFMSVTITLLEKSYSIHLSSTNYSYYMVGNIINADVICYLLQEHYGLELNSKNIIYKLDIIDQNIAVKTLTHKDAILFNMDSNYTILYESENDDISINGIIENDNDNDSDSLPDLISIE